MNDKRLIEVAFPLQETSIDAVHEKNVRHGHISTLHIWPARRPLAAARAALIATLLPDPGNKKERDAIIRRLGGKAERNNEGKWVTNGGVLHWGRESRPDMDWFRKEIRKAYGDKAPRVLDPFAGGGAIPLEAMRLGCEASAADINPVAWFVLKCTLDYPQKLAGQKLPLPDFALRDEDFMADYFERAKGLTKKNAAKRARQIAGRSYTELQTEMFADEAIKPDELQATMPWHVRAWGRWVLARARQKLSALYPTYAEYCTLQPYQRVELATEPALKPVPVNAETGEPMPAVLNAGAKATDLADLSYPRWVAKPSVAYLWARTVQCKSCRAELPLLKTCWLAKKAGKYVRLTMQPRPDKSGVEFDIEASDKLPAGRTAKDIGAGTKSGSGFTCPCCGTTMTMEDIRLRGRSGEMRARMTAVVVDGYSGKEYRLPTEKELQAAQHAQEKLRLAFSCIPFGLPEESIPTGGSRKGGGSPFTPPAYGIEKWCDLFIPRQLVALAAFVDEVREVRKYAQIYSDEQLEAIYGLMYTAISKIADRGSTICSWTVGWDKIRNTFARFALPMTWDFVESAPLADSSGCWPGAVEWAARYIEHAIVFADDAPQPHIIKDSAIHARDGQFDIIVTDPPYYDAIPYSDLMDFFYVWLRRTLYGLSPEMDAAFAEPLSPKWNHDGNDGELIDDASRFSGNKEASKRNYEDGMARAFKACHAALAPDGRFVIVFAHKQPDAWETLVSAMIQAGFVVSASWPIQTESSNRVRALASAALSSSVWLVCKKRDLTVRAGWDTNVLREMQESISQKLRDFWDAGIRGPDFVWAATGPALEAYSRYPAIRKTDSPGETMSVAEFLGHVRRIVVDFVVGRVLSQGADGDDDAGNTTNTLDGATTYYLLHRQDFGMDAAPAGACILYALSCGVPEQQMQRDELIAKGKDGGSSDDDGSGSGGEFKLVPWDKRGRRRKGFGDTADGSPAPLIDQLHRLMQLWAAGDVMKVNDYIDGNRLRAAPLFAQVLQAVIEQSRAETDGGSGNAGELSILESLQNHLGTKGAPQPKLL